MSCKYQRLLSFLMCNIYASRLKELFGNTLLNTYLNNTRYVFQRWIPYLHAYEILQTSDDNREKLQAMELFKNTHLVKLELLSNATTIDSALNYIRSKQQQKRLGLDSTSSDNSNSSDCCFFSFNYYV
jgi:hypothetical protein